MKSLLLLALFLGATSASADFNPEPERFAKLTAKIHRQWMDYSGADPVMREEVVCAGEVMVPIYTWETRVQKMKTLESTIPNTLVCPFTYQQWPGNIHVSGAISYYTEGTLPLKDFSSWFYFIPDGTPPGVPQTFPGDSVSAATASLDLRHMRHRLGSGQNNCVIGTPELPEPDPVVPSPRINRVGKQSSDEPTMPCIVGEYLWGTVDIEDTSL